MRVGVGVIVLLVLAAALWFGSAHDNEAPVRPAAVPPTLPELPIDVRLPAFGSLDITLLGPDGLPWQTTAAEDRRISITRAGESHSGAMSNSLQLDRDGKASATPVLCGQAFEVRWWAGDSGELTVAGPQRAGERVAVELRMSVDAPILVARVIDGNGAPITGSVFLEYESTRGSGPQTAAAADGRLRVVVSDRLLDATPTITLTRADGNNRPTDEQASVQLRAPLVKGINDLGDVVLTAAPLLVSGRVQWADGSPVEPSQIQVERTRDDPTAGWERPWNLRPERTDDGRFVVRGAADDRRFRVSVFGNFAPRAPVEFAAGTEGLVIRVEKGGSVAAHFQVDAATPWQQLQYRLVPATHAPDPTVGSLPVEQDGGVRCHWNGLGAGPHRLTVECPGIEPPLVDLTIDVPRGAPATDPRLDRIDLRGRLRTFTVSVTDALGAPIHGTRDAGVLIKGRDDPQAVWFGRALDAEDGRAELIAQQPVDILVFAPGFQAREVSGVFADTAVTLASIPSVRVRLVTSLAQLPAGTTTQLHCARVREGGARAPQYLLERDGGSGSGGRVDNLFPSPRLALAADGTAELVFGDDSPHRLFLLLRRGRQRGSVGLQPSTLDPKTVTPGQVVELRIEPEALRKAIEALGKD